MRKINRKLKATRILQGLRQEDLGRKVGRSAAWVCGIELGQLEPSDLDIALLCRALNTPPEELFPSQEQEGEPKI